MNHQKKRIVLTGVLVLAGLTVLASVFGSSSSLPPASPNGTPAAAVGTPPPAAATEPAALAAVQQRLAANPNDTAALSDYGDLLMQAKRYPQAADAYATLVDLDPQNATAHMKLGAAFFYQGISTLAQKELKHAVELDPNNVEAQFNYALAMSHGPKADLAAATASWQAVARLDPNGQLGQQAMRMLSAAAGSSQAAQAAPPASATSQPQAQARP